MLGAVLGGVSPVERAQLGEALIACVVLYAGVAQYATRSHIIYDHAPLLHCGARALQSGDVAKE